MAIHQALMNKIPAAMLLVTQSSGSSPGRQGFKMAVVGDGQMIGSIGGGIMEHKLVEKTRDMLKNGVTKSSVLRQIHNKKATRDQSGMICSGEQEVLILPIPATSQDTIETILDHLGQFRKAILEVKPRGITVLVGQSIPGGVSRFFQQQGENDWSYQEYLGLQRKAFIIGGGHVSLALSRLLRILDFYVVVLDDRNDLLTLENNWYAHQKIYCSYDEIRDHLEQGPSVHVILMTFGYRDDDRAIRQILDLEFGYLGMMGSKAKIEQLRSELRKDGYSPVLLSKLKAPIGLQIKSQTPEEIAVSIAAEIIQHKNSENS